MAMTKKEQAEFDAAKKAVVVTRALSWTAPIEPDVPPPATYSELSVGWVYATYNGGRVIPACSSSIYHGLEKITKADRQGPRMLYSSELLALRALRHEVEKECAEKLASIDMQIQAKEKTDAK